MIRASVLAAALCSLWLIACGPAGEGGPAPATVDSLVPQAPAGWDLAGGPTVYDPETLYEVLNGGAPLYLRFGFRASCRARYQLGDDPLAAITLDVYDMGSDRGAFGMYRSVVPELAAPQPWGTEGCRLGTFAAAWKDRFYIAAEADDDRSELIRVRDEIMAAVTSAIAGSSGLPAILEALPAADRVAGSERLVAADLFGHSFLPGGVVATYEKGDAEFRLFFSDLDDGPAATAALDLMREHESKWGEVLEDIPGIGDGGFAFDDPGLGRGTVVRRGKFVAGVVGEIDGNEPRALLETLVTRLSGE